MKSGRVVLGLLLLMGTLVLLTGCFETNSPPVASFAYSPSSGESPLTVSFDASSSYDSDGTIATYQWTFGDGSNGTGVTTSHTYTSAGTYIARLTVTDDGGATDSATRTIQVFAPSPEAPPSDCNALPEVDDKDEYATIISIKDSKDNCYGHSEYNGKNPSGGYWSATVGEEITVTVSVYNTVAGPVSYLFIGEGFPGTWQSENHATVTITDKLQRVHLRVSIKNSDERYRAPYYDDMIQVFYDVSSS